jgi:hypothetical protein
MDRAGWTGDNARPGMGNPPLGSHLKVTQSKYCVTYRISRLERHDHPENFRRPAVRAVACPGSRLQGAVMSRKTNVFIGAVAAASLGLGLGACGTHTSPN